MIDPRKLSVSFSSDPVGGHQHQFVSRHHRHGFFPVRPFGRERLRRSRPNALTAQKIGWEKVDFLTKKIECTTPIPFDQAWSRASKKVGVVHSIAFYDEKSAAQGAKKGRFCMGILVTLSLSKIKAPIGRKKYVC